MSYLDLIYGLHLGLEPDAGRTELRIGILIEHLLCPGVFHFDTFSNDINSQKISKISF